MTSTSAPVVETAGLTRRFGDVIAIDSLDLAVPSAGVVGLVGPNGSGKSTLLRMLLGLVRPTSGRATAFGESIETPERYLSRVGALIESPAFVPALSARQNLRVLASLRGLPGGRVDEVLDIVGLVGRDREPVKNFSLGMKQRLGIAGALLPDPELLILDEPTNGLDPAGIVEIRTLLERLGREGRTVIVSSHLLAELEAVCDYLVMVRFGRLMFSGPIRELMSRAAPKVEVRPEHDADTGRLRTALVAAGWPVDERLRVTADGAAAAAINRTASAAGVTLRRLAESRDSLEEIFLTLADAHVDASEQRTITAGTRA